MQVGNGHDREVVALYRSPLEQVPLYNVRTSTTRMQYGRKSWLDLKSPYSPWDFLAVSGMRRV